MTEVKKYLPRINRISLRKTDIMDTASRLAPLIRRKLGAFLFRLRTGEPHETELADWSLDTNARIDTALHEAGHLLLDFIAGHEIQDVYISRIPLDIREAIRSTLDIQDGLVLADKNLELDEIDTLTTPCDTQEEPLEITIKRLELINSFIAGLASENTSPTRALGKRDFTTLTCDDRIKWGDIRIPLRLIAYFLGVSTEDDRSKVCLGIIYDDLSAFLSENLDVLNLFWDFVLEHSAHDNDINHQIGEYISANGYDERMVKLRTDYEKFIRKTASRMLTYRDLNVYGGREKLFQQLRNLGL
ncbi:MAG: hypothetical protein ACD_51C00205G0003 [uncultured bacterium]|nr:MAG: hypothetical protein ACD_51C00205G0003 [uncultured bacterium]OGJ48102.1 MAG: hypothetical protein A2244_01270 [Candidatus Peregrinibacteria bacterium RIFOXYA2_FULL_41_18]OGJ53234.1 MAG: hypothetical protein A2448_04890 [Candidatus Peregrinibacteria bacterium RIFOXYC2_FULL_41_22]OGJ54244.1 MAG: hypothetical protein A2336_02075 [Candidatus Peregrinibacteria bacterium RIFOXYB2_FULL_41_88]